MTLPDQAATSVDPHVVTLLILIARVATANYKDEQFEWISVRCPCLEESQRAGWFLRSEAN